MAETAPPLTLGLHNRRKNILAGVILVQKAMRTAFTKNTHISRQFRLGGRSLGQAHYQPLSSRLCRLPF
jgi:hypothetical protein